MQDAKLHALCEVIENDQFSFWAVHSGKSGGAPDALSLCTVKDEQAQCLLERIATCNLSVAVWKINSSLSMPTFYCVLYESRDGAPYPFRSSGIAAHPCKSKALLSALLEAIQGRLSFISGARDDLHYGAYDSARVGEAYSQPWRKAILESEPSLDYDSINDFPTSSVRQLLDSIVEEMEAVGFEEPLWLDISQRGCNLCFVKVLAPGAELDVWNESYWPGKRMRDVLGT
jgi:ribosomal protein S12 methylthiotransferase accessory factor